MRRAHPGRPPLDDRDPSLNLSLKLPSKLYDDACLLAARQRVTLPEAVRRAIRRAADDADDDAAD